MPVKERGGKGAKALVGRIAGLRSGLSVTVGVHSDDANHTHGSTGELLTVGDIATIHEFGAPAANIPQRSFIRGWYDESQAEIRAVLKTELAAVVSGKRTVAQAFERAALRFEGSVKERIRRHIPPPLKPATIARKGSSTPLIDSGQLRNAIRARVGGRS